MRWQVLLQTLVGQRVVIELHDDTQVKGLLEAVSESMTCELSDVSIEPCRYFLASVSTPTSAPSSSSSSNARGLSSTPSSAASSSPSPSASLQLSGTLGPSGRKQQHARGASATAASTTRSSTQTITLLHSPAVVGAGGGDIEQKDVQHCDTHTVLGRAIRYVHIPDALNVSSALDAHVRLRDAGETDGGMKAPFRALFVLCLKSTTLCELGFLPLFSVFDFTLILFSFFHFTWLPVRVLSGSLFLDLNPSLERLRANKTCP